VSAERPAGRSVVRYDTALNGIAAAAETSVAVSEFQTRFAPVAFAAAAECSQA